MINKVFLYNPSNNIRRIAFIVLDLLAFSLSLYFSIELRKDLSEYGTYSNYLFPIFLVVKFSVFGFYGLYDVSWKSVSIQDIVKIAKASIISNCIIFILVFGSSIQEFSSLPKSLILIDLVFTFMLSSLFKMLKRMYLEVMRFSLNSSGLKRTLIIGAGNSGEQITREITRSSKRQFLPIGFIDDENTKQNLYIQGLKVLGKVKDLPEIINKYNIDTVLISVLTANRNFHRMVLSLAKQAGVTDVKVISTINDISNSVKIKIQDVRDIDVSDLIGRQAVSINTKEISNYIENKRVLITGAAGSIGSEIAAQVAFYNPSKIGILDINESDLADLEVQLGRKFPYEKIKMYLCDISHEAKISKIIENFRPDVVFHAAAYKHVPVMEKYPEEAVRVNILGTYYLTQASVRFGVKNFILISTDKAVNPTSIMGASKRIAEYIVTSAGNNSNSNFVAVRFGNVLGSRGSALPIFIDQMKAGGPITVTHPEMKRYFMTIPEAVALVLQASATGSSGDVFVLDMGDPVKIVDLVKDLISLNNLVPDKDIKIVYTGIREGEKLFEEVLTAEEGVISTSHEKIFKARLIDRHSKNSISDLIKVFISLNGHTSKEEWHFVFKHYVPTFSGSVNIYSIDSEQGEKLLNPLNNI